MQQLDENREYWFVMGSTSVNREIRISSDMRQQHLECFVPLKYEVKRQKNRNEEKLVPAIRGLFFVRGTETRLKEYVLKSRDNLYFHRSAFSENTERREKLIVPDGEMDRFIRFVKSVSQSVKFYKPEEITWREGDLVRVTIGSRKYEGKIVHIKGRKRFSLALKDSVIATVNLSPDLIEAIEHYTEDEGWVAEEVKGGETHLVMRTPSGRKKRKTKYNDREQPRSKDVEGDKKLLMAKARRLLFEIDDEHYENQREYQVTQAELMRVMKRLSPYKGVTAALEGELALCMFLGAMALQENTEAATERLRKAIEKVNETSMLRLRMRFYLAKLTNDKNGLMQIARIVNSWDARHLQRKQQEFVKETEQL